MNIKDLGIILERTELPFENQAVLNPGCIEKDGITHMFYRAVKKDNFSSIGYCQLKENKVIFRQDKPILEPEYFYEKHGVEDPRIVEFENLFYMFYSAYDGKNVHAAFATSYDLKTWKKQGVISPSITYHEAVNYFKNQNIPEKYFWYEKHYEEAIAPDVLLWEKDSFIFPKRISNKIYLLHRIMPGMQLIAIDSFLDLKEEFWKDYLANLNKYMLLNPKYPHESRKLGGGCPPIETPEGWLIIYHTVEDNPLGRIYHAAAALLDLNEPNKVIGRLKTPLFSPEASWEKTGAVPNAVFPTGAIVKNGLLTIYYGAADKLIAAKELNLSELLITLKNSPEVT